MEIIIKLQAKDQSTKQKTIVPQGRRQSNTNDNSHRSVTTQHAIDLLKEHGTLTKKRLLKLLHWDKDKFKIPLHTFLRQNDIFLVTQTKHSHKKNSWKNYKVTLRISRSELRTKSTQRIISILREHGLRLTTKQLAQRFRKANGGRPWDSHTLGSLSRYLMQNNIFEIVRNNPLTVRLRGIIHDSFNSEQCSVKSSDLSYNIGDALEVFDTIDNVKAWHPVMVVDKSDTSIMVEFVHFDGTLAIDGSQDNDMIRKPIPPTTPCNIATEEKKGDVDHIKEDVAESKDPENSKVSLDASDMVQLLRQSNIEPISDDCLARALRIFESNYGCEYNLQVLQDIVHALQGLNKTECMTDIDEEHIRSFNYYYFVLGTQMDNQLFNRNLFNNTYCRSELRIPYPYIFCSNPYVMGDKLQIYNQEMDELRLATVRWTDNNWIVIHYDDRSSECVEQLHIIQDKQRIRSPPDWICTVVEALKKEKCNLQQVHALNQRGHPVHKCFSEEIFGTADRWQEISEQYDKYMTIHADALFGLFSVNGMAKMISILSELFNVNVTVFEYDIDSKTLFELFESGECPGIPSVMLVRYGLKYAVIRDSCSKFQRPLNTAEHRDLGEKWISLRDMRFSKWKEVMKPIQEPLIKELQTELKKNNKLLSEKDSYLKRCNELSVELKQCMGKLKTQEETNEALVETNQTLRDRVCYLNGTSDKLTTLDIYKLMKLESTLQNAMSRIRKERTRLIERRFSCIVCLERPKNILIDGCNHVILCQQCESKLHPKICPMCKATYRSIKKIHI
eukprot:919894_1